MAKFLGVFFYFLIICATQSDSFKIISKIKNYLLPTTTSTTTALPILPEFGQNGTDQEIPWGEEATEETFTTTSERIHENHDSISGEKGSDLLTYATTQQTSLPSGADSVYPGMPEPTPTTNNGLGKLLPGKTTTSDDVWQESTTKKDFDSSYNRPQDFLPALNSSNGMSDNGFEGLNPSGNLSGINNVNYGQPNSINNQSSNQFGGNSVGENLYDSFSNGNQTGGSSGGTFEDGSLYGIPASNGNQSNQQNIGSNDGGNLNGKPASSGNQNSQQSGGTFYGVNDSGPKPKNNTANSNLDGTLIFPDNPLLNPTPEPGTTHGVQGSRMGNDSSSKAASNSTKVPVDGGRRVLDAPIKDCGKGRKLDGNGNCKKEARK